MVAILQGDQARLERAQHRDRAAENERRPQHEMHPDRRREPELDHSSETDDDQAEKENHKDRGAIAGVLRRQIEAAALACSTDAEESGE